MNVRVLGLLAILLLSAPPVAGWLVMATAPVPSLPQPTAFASGPSNMTSAADFMRQSGFTVNSLVSSLRLSGSDDLVLIPAALRPPANGDTQALDRVLAEGGSVWVAGGSSLGPWLDQYGMALGQQPLIQGNLPPENRFQGQVALATETIGPGLTQINAVRPSFLLAREGAGWIPLLRATAQSHLDIDADGVIGRSDPPGPFLVGAMQRRPAGGALIVTADASLLSDQAWSVPDAENAKFLKAVLAEINPARIVIDESQHGWTSADAPWAHLTSLIVPRQHAPLWAIALAGPLAVGVLVLTIRRVNALAPHDPHVPSDPALPPADLGKGIVIDVAWELLARRSGRPLAELRAAGQEAAQGLAEDGALRRVLLGQGSSQDSHHVLSSYVQETLQ